ncbi:MAG TPA: alpha/beta hydrolase [Frankiaceae bacterium]|nr:alpha/beta hydrolase [Frankiaceae bacterium]
MDHERLQDHIPGDGVGLHVEAYGSGAPVTVFAAGLGGTIPETRTLASGVPGTRVFFDFRGHGASGVPANGDWSYDALSRDLRSVADAAGAAYAVGMSMGAAAILGVLASDPGRFERCVLFLPAILDRPRDDVAVTRLGRLAARIDAGERGAVEELLAAELPPPVRSSPEAAAYVRSRAETLSGPGVAGLVRALVTSRPVRDRVLLSAVAAPCLVIGQEGDDVHPAQVAREIAAALPNARLHVFDAPGGLWAHRRALRSLVGDFLS